MFELEDLNAKLQEMELDVALQVTLNKELEDVKKSSGGKKPREETLKKLSDYNRM